MLLLLLGSVLIGSAAVNGVQYSTVTVALGCVEDAEADGGRCSVRPRLFGYH